MTGGSLPSTQSRQRPYAQAEQATDAAAETTHREEVRRCYVAGESFREMEMTVARKLVMGYTKYGEKCHLVDGDDLAVALCGAEIDRHVRQLMDGPLVLYADHWEDDALSGSNDRTCAHCLEKNR